MKRKFDPEEAVEFINNDVMPIWVLLKDTQREAQDHEKHMYSSTIDKLDTILELFYEKSYKEGLTLYCEWMHEEKATLLQKDFTMLKNYAEYLGLDPHMLDGLLSAEEPAEDDDIAEQ